MFIYILQYVLALSYYWKTTILSFIAVTSGTIYRPVEFVFMILLVATRIELFGQHGSGEEICTLLLKNVAVI